MYKVIGDKLIKERVVDTGTQTVTIKSEIEIVENPDNETIEIGELPERPMETETHYVIMTLKDDVLTYELRKRPAPLEDQINNLNDSQADQDDLIMGVMLGGM